MHESTIRYLRCVRCGSNVDSRTFVKDSEIIEGILECQKCKLLFPIIEKIPIISQNTSLLELFLPEGFIELQEMKK